ncbi:hypothetical protein CcNV_068 [Crangon crangon nudivirus]|uniref:Uncharacterized protein n=1 Tax=Crangon crangon nudivirus TaxID=2880838 RepID=A0AAE8Y3D1_9VIRU|nr:hypothetical protein QKT25_gp069 [Crangon crangon nudivirus]UBZ25553.1 hypothetical protein CcNV_068 [Crangon crangon nudivirus]
MALSFTSHTSHIKTRVDLALQIAQFRPKKSTHMMFPFRSPAILATRQPVDFDVNNVDKVYDFERSSDNTTIMVLCRLVHDEGCSYFKIILSDEYRFVRETTYYDDFSLCCLTNESIHDAYPQLEWEDLVTTHPHFTSYGKFHLVPGLVARQIGKDIPVIGGGTMSIRHVYNTLHRFSEFLCMSTRVTTPSDLDSTKDIKLHLPAIDMIYNLKDHVNMHQLSYSLIARIIHDGEPAYIEVKGEITTHDNITGRGRIFISRCPHLFFQCILAECRSTAMQGHSCPTEMDIALKPTIYLQLFEEKVNCLSRNTNELLDSLYYIGRTPVSNFYIKNVKNSKSIGIVGNIGVPKPVGTVDDSGIVIESPTSKKMPTPEEYADEVLGKKRKYVKRTEGSKIKETDKTIKKLK